MDDASRSSGARWSYRRTRRLVRTADADGLADRLERALDDGVALLALTMDERAIILDSLEDPPAGLAELRGALMKEHQWRQRTGLDA